MAAAAATAVAAGAGAARGAVRKSAASARAPGTGLGLIDVGANLTDGMFQGVYHGKQRHESDFDLVLQRAFGGGDLSQIIVTGTNVAESRDAVALCNQYAPHLFCTVGVHPTRAGDFDKDASTYDSLLGLIRDNPARVVAVGECGLDYDRTHFCPRATQRRHFARAFDLAEATGLPMFLHDRNTGTDFLEYMRDNRGRYSGGVVHSFTGSADLALAYLDLGLYIGINGCSLKTPENLDVVRMLPADRLLIETDAPWCEIRPSHASHAHVVTQLPTKKVFERGFCLKSRCEPAHLVQVLEAVASVRGETDIAALARVINDNTRRLFRQLEMPSA